jgi:hypothetical protein
MAQKKLEQILEGTEVKRLIDELGPHIDSRVDFTYDPEYVKGREDVCAVKRMAENGSSYGFDTVYLVWKDTEGVIKSRKLVDSRYTKDYLHIREITESQEQIIIKVGSNGDYSGHPGDQVYEISKKELGIK